MTIQLSDLKFPSGEFSHTMLAEFNGLDRKKVWSAYQKAIKDGVIVATGNTKFSGKGKPAQLWKVADGQPVPIVDKPTTVIVKVDDVPVVKSQPKVTVKAVEVVEVKPVEKPFEVEMGGSVEVNGGETIVDDVSVVESISIPVIKIQPLPADVTTIEQVCPFCKTPLLSVQTPTGVTVWCGVNDFSICSCSENPYGHSNNVKNAVEILMEKFFKFRRNVKA